MERSDEADARSFTLPGANATAVQGFEGWGFGGAGQFSFFLCVGFVWCGG